MSNDTILISLRNDLVGLSTNDFFDQNSVSDIRWRATSNLSIRCQFSNFTTINLYSSSSILLEKCQAPIKSRMWSCVENISLQPKNFPNEINIMNIKLNSSSGPESLPAYLHLHSLRKGYGCKWTASEFLAHLYTSRFSIFFSPLYPSLRFSVSFFITSTRR